MDIKKQIKRQNEFNRNNYDHFNLMLPKGEKERLQTIAKDKEKSLNALIYECILKIYPKENT